jgi:hypothetical protein
MALSFQLWSLYYGTLICTLFKLNPKQEEKKEGLGMPSPLCHLSRPYFITPAVDFLSCIFDNLESQPSECQINEKFEIEIPQGPPFFTQRGGSRPWI